MLSFLSLYYYYLVSNQSLIIRETSDFYVRNIKFELYEWLVSKTTKTRSTQNKSRSASEWDPCFLLTRTRMSGVWTLRITRFFRWIATLWIQLTLWVLQWTKCKMETSTPSSEKRNSEEGIRMQPPIRHFSLTMCSQQMWPRLRYITSLQDQLLKLHYKATMAQCLCTDKPLVVKHTQCWELKRYQVYYHAQ